jgi:hypothetical protein
MHKFVARTYAQDFEKHVEVQEGFGLSDDGAIEAVHELRELAASLKEAMSTAGAPAAPLRRIGDIGAMKRLLLNIPNRGST